MILNCPKCATRYLVADSAISEEGRNVRCANCAFTWFQEASEPEEPAAPIPAPVAATGLSPEEVIRRRPLLPGFNLPAVVVTHPAPDWLKRACIMLLPLAIILAPFAYRKSLTEQYPELFPLFKPFGIYYTQGLTLADVGISKTPQAENGGATVTVNCSVINLAIGNRTLPTVAATLIDSHGHDVALSPNLVDTGKTMRGGDVQRCSPFTFETKESDIALVRLDLADPFDFTLRRK